MSQGTSGHYVSLEPGPEYWELTCGGGYDRRALLTGLTALLPPGLTLYVEGTSISPMAAAYFAKRPAEHPMPIHTSVIWPRPKAYHMPMTQENVAGLADLMQNLATPEVGDHVHAYLGDTAYFIWYDAWFDSPLYVRRTVPEEAIRRLCDSVGCEYSPSS